MFTDLKKLAIASATGLAISFAATASSAATFVYDLLDNPDGAETVNGYDYGLRLDDSNMFFSFENGASATLTYDDVALTAVISGTMVESLGFAGDNTTRVFGDTWTLSYTMDGLTDLSGGQFLDETGNGSGSISFNGTTISLGSKSRPDGVFFYLTDDSNRDPNPNDEVLVGEGWVGGSGTQDFLFLAELNNGGDLPDIPLPAAGWMLIAGLGGLGALRRRRKQ